jgi:hypothetical protein
MQSRDSIAHLIGNLKEISDELRRQSPRLIKTALNKSFILSDFGFEQAELIKAQEELNEQSDLLAEINLETDERLELFTQKSETLASNLRLLNSAPEQALEIMIDAVDAGHVIANERDRLRTSEQNLVAELNAVKAQLAQCRKTHPVVQISSSVTLVGATVHGRYDFEAFWGTLSIEKYPSSIPGVKHNTSISINKDPGNITNIWHGRLYCRLELENPDTFVYPPGVIKVG